MLVKPTIALSNGPDGSSEADGIGSDTDFEQKKSETLIPVCFSDTIK
jgi:hypothetical protein